MHRPLSRLDVVGLSLTHQQMLYGSLAAWLMGIWVILAVNPNRPIVLVITAWLASPLPLLFLRLTMEESFGGLFSVKTQSWALLFGDTLWLPLAFGAAALGHGLVPENSFFRSWLWLVSCIVVGVAAGTVFHALDTIAYNNAGAELALLSPTKLAHDFVAYPFLFGGLLYIGLPVMMHDFRGYGLPVLLLVCMWGLMGYADSQRGLNPLNLHPLWDVASFRVIN